MKKRIIAIFLIMVLFSAVMAAAASAEGVPTISVNGSAEAERNDEITLTVDLENNPGICAFSLSLLYDSSRLELVSLEHGKISGNELWTVNGSNATWVSFGDTDYDGTILTARFRVLDSAPAGEAQVSVGFSKGDIGNFEEEEVNFTVSPATVSVAGTGGENTAVPPQESTSSVLDNGSQKTVEVQNSAEPVISTEKTEEQSDNASAGTEMSEDGAVGDSRETEEAPRAEKQDAAASGGVSPRIIILIVAAVIVIAVVAAYMVLRKRK